MNDMNDGPARDLYPQPLAYQANALPTELLGLAKEKTRKRDRNNEKQQDRKRERKI